MSGHLQVQAPGSLSPLAWLAVAKGWGRESLAEASGVPEDTMRRLWCGRNSASRRTAARLAGPLRLAPADVVDPLKWLADHGPTTSSAASPAAPVRAVTPDASPAARVARAYSTPPTDDRDWRDRAVCRDVDPELFWPEPGMSAQAALALCASCPVLGDCREAFLAQPRDEGGVWFATTPLDRETHAARQREAAA